MATKAAALSDANSERRHIILISYQNIKALVDGSHDRGEFSTPYVFLASSIILKLTAPAPGQKGTGVKVVGRLTKTLSFRCGPR